MSSAKRWPVLLTLVCIPARAGGEEVVVRDERPVAAAIELLQERFRVPITYEDPPYLYRGYVVDVRGKRARPGRPTAVSNRWGFPLGMKETELRFDVPAGSDAGGVEIALVNLLNANNHSDRPPAFFGLKKMGGHYHVYPKRIKTDVGDYESYHSVLDVRISLEPKNRNCTEFWVDLCAALARSANVYIGNGIGLVPGNMDACRTRIGGHDVPARQMLLDYVAERDASPPWGLRGWDLLSHAVGERSFVLRLAMIPLESLGKEYWITDVRPLEKAAQRFEEEFKTAVTYEDPLNLFEGDIEPVADKARPASLPADPTFRELVSTKRRSLNFFLMAAAAPEEQQLWIQKAVDAYNRGDNPYDRGKDPPAKFEVRRMGERFHIIPVEVKRPPTNTNRISLPWIIGLLSSQELELAPSFCASSTQQ